MIIDCISDLHGTFPELEGGDLLIVAGDLTGSDQMIQYHDFNFWLTAQQFKYREIIVVAGNHDGLIQKREWPLSQLAGVYLQDDGFEFEGLKIWGSPWTPEFCNWYFMKPRGEQIAAKWALIPEDTNILITHGPPAGILDYCSPRRNKRLGCEDLYRRLKDLKDLKLHVFGHIHGGYGHIETSSVFPGVQFVNAAQMDEDYEMTNKPIRVTL